MPPKKKRKTSVSPGIAVTYLGEEYASLSETQTMLVGHVLNLYVNDPNRSVTNVLNEIEQKHEIKAQKYDVTRVVSRFEKMRKLTDSAQFLLFKQFCEGVFELPKRKPSCIEGTSLVKLSDQQGEIEIPQGTALTQQRMATISRKKSCAKCKKFMFSLGTERKLRENMRKKFQLENSALRRKLQMQRVLNQKIRRQKQRIEMLKESASKAESERNSQVKKKLAVLRRKVNTMEKNKTRRKLYIMKSQKLRAERHEREKDNALKESKRIIRNQAEILSETQVANDMLGEELESLRDSTVQAHSGKKQYSIETRMMVYDAIINQVPTLNIPVLMKSFSKRLGVPLDHVPHRTTVEQMARELGVISQLQCAEALVADNNATIAFDATTQEGVHINALIITTETKTLACAIDELPGGCAEDYSNHIVDSLDDLAKLYVQINNNATYQETRCKMIDTIKNTMTDRVAANHAAIRLVNEHWGKSLNELYCNLHPLDSISTCCRAALKKEEKDHKSLYGKDCVAGNIVLQVNKLRYKDGKGDPKGFVVFLESKNLPRGLLPRYRGNRLHIVFHICGILIHHYDKFLSFFQDGTSCGGLRKAIYEDFSSGVAQREMLILGLIGKYLTGPWMKKFYVAPENQTIDVLGAIKLIKEVNTRIKEQALDAESFLDRQTDFFDDKISKDDTTLAALKHRGQPIFDRSCVIMVKESLKAASDVIQRQYKKYFDEDVLPDILEEETKSCRLNNIDCEEIMGMFSAAKNRAPNATLCYLSSKMRSKKNNTVSYLDNLESKLREDLIKRSVPIASKDRKKRRRKTKEIQMEIADRDARKKQKREMKDRKKLEKKLKKMETVEEIDKEFPDLERKISDDLKELLSGNSVGRDIFHVWQEEDGEKKSFMGRIERIKARKMCRVGYWDVKEETHEDAVDYDISLYELGADLINEDLFFCS